MPSLKRSMRHPLEIRMTVMDIMYVVEVPVELVEAPQPKIDIQPLFLAVYG